MVPPHSHGCIAKSTASPGSTGWHRHRQAMDLTPIAPATLGVQLMFHSFYNARQKEGSIHPKIVPPTAQGHAAANGMFISLNNCSAPLILVSFQVETNSPRPTCDATQSFRVGCEPRKSIFKLTHNAGHGASDFSDLRLFVPSWFNPDRGSDDFGMVNHKGTKLRRSEFGSNTRI